MSVPGRDDLDTSDTTVGTKVVPLACYPSGASRVFFPSNAKSSRSTIRKVVLLGPSVGRKAVSLTIENWLPSIARWKVSATIRAPTPFSRPVLNSASRRM